jgi:hypothetical protein
VKRVQDDSEKNLKKIKDDSEKDLKINSGLIEKTPN